jgi:hypothetical protein
MAFTAGERSDPAVCCIRKGRSPGAQTDHPRMPGR